LRIGMSTADVIRKKVPAVGFMACLLLMTAILASCAPTYDDVGDQMLVDAQKQADDGLIRLENLERQIDELKKRPNASEQKDRADAESQASYESNIDFYSKLQSSMAVLAARMTSNPDLSTQKIGTALENLDKNIDSTREVHEAQNSLS